MGRESEWKGLSEADRQSAVGHEQMRAELTDLRERNERMRSFIQRLGYGHTDWPEQKIGCEQPGTGCVAQCMSRCSNVDHLNATIYRLRADVGRLRAILDTTPEDVGRVLAAYDTEHFQMEEWDQLREIDRVDHIEVGATILAYLKRKAGVLG